MSVVDERQPLLAGNQPPAENDRNKKADHSATPIRSRSFVVILLYLCLLLFTYGDALQLSPRIRIFEAIICYRYYEQHNPSQIRAGRDVVGPGAIGGVDEMACKIDAVAGELASLNGYLDMFAMIPGLLLAIPFGWVADKYGRMCDDELGMETLTDGTMLRVACHHVEPRPISYGLDVCPIDDLVLAGIRYP